MRHGRFWIAISLMILVGWAVSLAQQARKPIAPVEEKDDEPSPEEAKEKAIAERFKKVLETSPRRGTALDRLYGYHVERGTLEQLINEYKERTKKNAKDGNAWMILGLIESQRGKDAAAAAAFREAEATLPDNPIPGYYLGQVLVLVGQPEAAAEAYERAITRKPNRNDLIDIFQALGRVYQRAQKTDRALDVWNRLEKLFPDDARVQEQIATTLVEEGQFDQALPRIEKLAATSEDKYRQSTFRMEAAELKVKLKKSAEAIADFEKLLAELNPESWLHRDARRRIEDIFLRSDDLDGLAKYYEKWLAKNPTDLDAIARLAKNLTSQGRTIEARKWLEQGLTSAPSNRGLRQALIDQLVFGQKFAEAAQQYEAMDKADPNNPDTLREWGKMLMRDPDRPEAERKAAAAAIWKRLLVKKPNDPVTTSQVADLMRSATITDDAIALYRKAIQLAPEAAQYREYLGEFFHSLNRSEEAIATWRPIAEGSNRNSKNLARLAEVFAGFGYRKEAITAMTEAVALEGDDFGLLMSFAELLHQDGQNDASLEQIAVASKRTSNAEEIEQILLAQIKVYQATEKLGERINELERELTSGKEATAERWLRLARLFEANRQSDRASEAIQKASAKDPKSIPVLIAAGRIFESSGNLLAAADVNRKLAVLDRRFRTEYLTAVAKLEQRLGRREQALQAGRDLLAASPGNPDVYKFFADLCFQLGDQEEGLESLRRSVRANPSDPQGLITLANALGERVRQGEAIELLWRAFEKSNELEAKLGIIERLTQLYLENNQFDRLVERLVRERNEAEKAREMRMCLAQAYTTAGDLGTARTELEKQLTENTRDTNLLSQLVSLCESEGDIAAALKYQRQLNVAATNNYDHQLKLAQLLTRSGEADEAADIWVKLVAKDSEPHRNLAAIDQLATAGKFESVLAISARMLAQKPGNWELIYREGAALAAKGKSDEATKRFTALLAMKLPDDELSEITKHSINQAKKKNNNAKPTPPGQPRQPVFNPYASEESANRAPFTRRMNNLQRIRTAIGMEENYYSGGTPPAFYGPSDFGEARMASLGWLYEVARGKGKADSVVKQLREAKDKAGADSRPLWDWYYFQSLRNDSKDSIATALALSKDNDASGLLAYLHSISNRRNQQNMRMVRFASGNQDTTPPLPPDQLAQALACYEKLQKMKPVWLTSDLTQTMMTELKRAKKEKEETALYQMMVKEATTIDKIQNAIRVASTRKDLETALTLFTKLDQLQGPAKTASAVLQLPSRRATATLEYLFAELADDKRLAEAMKLFDLTLSTARRQNLAAPPTASSSRRFTARNGLHGSVPGKRSKQFSLSYPSASDYYDEEILQFLYTVFSKHRDADLLSDLFAHIQKEVAGSQGAEKMYMHLALGYMYWWNEEKDEAIGEILSAVALAPNDHNLLMEASSLREQNGQPEVALQLLDSINPLDTQVMQRREENALRLAERTGNVERARLAAERLFGLRLDSDKQLELAGKMFRLGLPQLAETVLNRAQRQAGNKTATLVKLMTQYQSQNQTDLAVQIARQILRKGPSLNFSPYRGRDETDSARDTAIGVLARSGQLKENIERAEAQLKASPKSIQIHQTLVGYYQAGKETEKLKETLRKMATLKPDDGKMRTQVAQQLMQIGDRDGAIAEYKAAIKLDPSMFAYRYWEIQNLFSQADQFEELAKLIDEIDMRKLGSNFYSISQVVTSLLQNDKSKEMGLKIFKKAWEAFPQYRSNLLSQFYDDSIWRLPEIYAYAKEAVIPREDTEADPWQSATETLNVSQEGRVDGVITRMLEIARRQQRLPELKSEMQAALAKRPDWTAGKALLGVVEIQGGDRELGKKLWQEAFADTRSEIPPIARFVLCQELEFYAGVESIAVATLEAGLEEILKDQSYEMDSTPIRRLVWWYEQLGRQDDAKKLIRRLGESTIENPGYGGGYWEYRVISSRLSLARELNRLGESIDSVRILNKLLSEKDMLEAADQYYGNRASNMVEQALKTTLESLKPSTLPNALNSLLKTEEKRSADQPAIDLVILFESRDLSRSKIDSVFAKAIKASEKAPALREQALAQLAGLKKQFPDDFSVQIATALASLANQEAGTARTALQELVKLMDAHPLEALPATGKTNARQRSQAMLQVPLWLAARECLNKKQLEFQELGEKLAIRAVAAARRQNDPMLAAAILREWGQLDLDRGDKVKAESRWKELLTFMMPKPSTGKKIDPALPTNPPTAPGPAPAVPAKSPQSRVPGTADYSFVSTTAPLQPPAVFMVPLSPSGSVKGSVATGTQVTAEQFQQIYALALFAADKQMADLSVRAIKDVLSGGPLVPAKMNQRMNNRLTTKFIGGVQYLVQGGGEKQIDIDRALINLIPRWRALGVKPGEIFDLVLTAVLPESRPAEVFLYADGQTFGVAYRMVGNSWMPTNSPIEGESEGKGLCEILCDLAIESGRVEALRTRAKTRLNQPLGELSAQILLANLAIRTKDDSSAIDLFKQMGTRIQKDSLQATNEKVSSIILPLLQNPKFSDLISPFVEKAAENFLTSNNLQRAAELRFKLAERHLAKKDEAAARAQFKIVEGFGKKAAATRGEYDVHMPLAQEYLKAGWLEETLRELALHADELATAVNSGNGQMNIGEPTTQSLPKLVKLLLATPAAKRYQLLKDWSLPVEGRKSIRYFVGVMPRNLPPPIFGKQAEFPEGEIVSTMVLLASAAKESGKLDELKLAAEKSVADKVENAAMFLAFVKLIDGEKAESAAKAFGESIFKRLTDKPEEKVRSRYDYQGNQPVVVHLSDVAFVQMCLKNAQLAFMGLELMGPILHRAEAMNNHEVMTLLRSAQDRYVANISGAPAAFENALPQRWHSTDQGSIWFAQDGYLTHASNDSEAHAIFDTPLTGTFEFSIDCFNGNHASGNLGFNGVLYEANSIAGSPSPGSSTSGIFTLGNGADRIVRTSDHIRPGEFNRLTFQVSPGKVRCLVNGKLFYEDTDSPPTSPWLMLSASPGQRPVFRNATLSGKPEVPAELNLSAGDFLAGWMPGFYGRTTLLRLLPKEKNNPLQTPDFDEQIPEEDEADKKFDWQLKGGEILGRKFEGSADKLIPSSLLYFRPLRSTETIRYEFFYEPGKTLCHPSLGRLVFLLEPEGVKLHWMCEPGSDNWSGLAVDNAVVDPANPHSGKLPLKVGQWNAMSLSLTGDVLKIELNNTHIYEAALPVKCERQFGLFHYGNLTATRARNVVLAGSWAKGPVTAADVALTNSAPSPAVARVRRWQLGEKYYFAEAGDIVKRTKSLTPAERFKVLAEWVLPNQSRPAFQMAGEFQPLDVLGVVDQKDQKGERRTLLGARFEAPALELVAAAKQAGKLDELGNLLTLIEFPAIDQLSNRSKLALIAVIRGAQARDADAQTALKQLLEASKIMPLDAQGSERWPELIAVAGTIDSPSLMPASRELAQEMNLRLNQAFLQKKFFENQEWWMRAFRALYSRAELAALPQGQPKANSDPAYAWWAPVSAVDGSIRKQAIVPARWMFSEGTVTHFPGYSDDYLFLRTPIRGDFEVACELSLQDWQEAHIRYGSYQFSLNRDRKTYTMDTSIRRNGISSGISSIILPPLGEKKSNTYQFKLVVKDGWFRALVDDRELASERIGQNPEPWLVLYSTHQNTGIYRNIKISGSPKIVDRIDLLADSGLGMWHAYHGNIMAGLIRNGFNGEQDWWKRGEEVYDSGKVPDPPKDGKPARERSFAESAIYYQRPILEDGVLEYEFYFETGKALVHPMLDRLVFQLEPEGIKLHWLTDGPLEKSGTPFDNLQEEATCRRGPAKLPIKEKSWNRIRLAIVGDTVKLALNGAEIYERAIEPTNQRLFGLFHYTDRSEARVRSMSYVGDWPKTLPSNDKLFEKK